MAIRRIIDAEVDPALLGGPSPEANTNNTNADQPAQPTEAPKVQQEVTLDAKYLEGFKGGFVGVARIAVLDSMLAPEMRDLVSPSIVVTAGPVSDPHRRVRPYSA